MYIYLLNCKKLQTLYKKGNSYKTFFSRFLCYLKIKLRTSCEFNILNWISSTNFPSSLLVNCIVKVLYSPASICNSSGKHSIIPPKQVFWLSKAISAAIGPKNQYYYWTTTIAQMNIYTLNRVIVATDEKDFDIFFDEKVGIWYFVLLILKLKFWTLFIIFNTKGTLRQKRIINYFYFRLKITVTLIDECNQKLILKINIA